MAFSMSLAEMVAELNGLLRPLGYALIAQPGQGSKYLLTHPDLDEVVKARQFLNHGLSGACHSGIILALSPKRSELTVESGFKLLATCHNFEPELLAEVLARAGQEAVRSHEALLAEANPLHRKLLEYREAITQAGFHLEPTFFVANLENYRELKRSGPDRDDLIGVTLDCDGQLAVSKLRSAFAEPIPFATALKVMALGRVREPAR